MAGFRLPAPSPLEMSDRNLSKAWTKFHQNFTNFELATGIKEKGDAIRIATLLSVIGQEAVDTFNTFIFPTGDETKFEKVLEKFENHCKGKKNTTYERYMFNCRNQQAGENIDSFVTALKALAESCEFGELKDSLILDRVILGISDRQLKQQLLRTEVLTLDKAIGIIRTAAAASAQLDHMTSESSEVHALSKHSQNRSGKPKYTHVNTPKHPTGSSSRNKSSKKGICRNCGGAFPHDGDCPAKGKRCNFCKKLNHFSKVCRSRLKSEPEQANTIQQNQIENPDSDSEYTFEVNPSGSRAKRPNINIDVAGTNIPAVIDTGATVNVMSEDTYQTLQVTPVLQHETINIYAYGSKKPLTVIGKFNADTTYKDNTVNSEFYVAKGVSDTLVSFTTAEALSLVRICYNVSTGTSLNKILDEYSDRFEGIGKLADATCKLHVNSDVTPVSQPHRRVPFKVRKKVEAELKRLKSLDIIEPVKDTPTPWVSPIRVVTKPTRPNEIRLCVDMRAPNKAIQRERHVTPTIDDIIANLNGATIFSKLDLNNGYHQIELDKDSRYLTVFSTHAGLFQFKRLNFGVNSGAEQFQNLIQSALAGLPGVINISDDILIYATGQEEMYNRLAACMQRLREKNLTLNKDKCQFNKSSIEFFGHTFSKEGVSPRPAKVEALKNAVAPTNKEEVRSFLGLATYCSRFIPRLATLSEPLRKLTKNNIPWEWGEAQEMALCNIKDAITNHCTMAFFDPQLRTEVVVDASPVGLCAMLTQHDDSTGKSSLVAIASRSLTAVEQRYSQTEREALAVTWGCLHFHLYLFGSDFTVITDHKPLTTLFNLPYSKPSARIEKWILKLQQYTYRVIYRPGKGNPADYLSRHPLNTTSSELETDEHVNFILTSAVPKAVKLEEIQSAVDKDELLSTCKRAHAQNTWHKEIAKAPASIKYQLQRLHNVKNEITVTQSGIVLRDNRIVIPSTLRKRIVQLAHDGHQGIVRTKQLLRQKVWFPGIDAFVEDMIKTCIPCQATYVPHQQPPLNMSPLPESPWSELSADFKELGQNKGYLLVVVDDYSRYPVIEFVTSTSSKAVLPKLDQIFSMFGIPRVLRTDNGPPFNSQDFAQFADHLGFKHRKIMPRWPQANGIAERLMKTIKKVYQTARMEHKNGHQALHEFLRNYRATVHPSTGMPPSSLLFQYDVRTRLPDISHFTVSNQDQKTRQHDAAAKQRMKSKAEGNRNIQSPNIEVGERVLLKRDGLVPNDVAPYDPIPYTVTSVNGSMVTAKRQDRTITRHISFFKPISLDAATDSTESKVMIDLDFEDTQTQPQLPSQRSSSRVRKPPRYLRDYVLD
ncbi:hypothetical protein HOLleu_15949 [Holothuria leucospilota]|uniref:RNA-directed DNA polymerase n=1 Tax=Holothuria leucospilota TaxID=206669 RepID=A0A9Q1HA07_HOLLE|nr:hypothetical protein HOLleu_15949 [Holothuria leucospilota]